MQHGVDGDVLERVEIAKLLYLLTVLPSVKLGSLIIGQPGNGSVIIGKKREWNRGCRLCVNGTDIVTKLDENCSRFICQLMIAAKLSLSSLFPYFSEYVLQPYKSLLVADDF